MLGLSAWHPVLFPYITSVFDLLLGGDFVIATDDDIISKDLGVSDLQQYTLFDVNMSGHSSAGSSATSQNRPSISGGPFFPIYPGGIRSYGNRYLSHNIDSTSLGSLSIVGQTIERWYKRLMPGNIPALSTLLNEWFRNQAKFNEGTVVTRGMPYARPGMLFLYLSPQSGSKPDDPRDLGMYYIDNLSYTYTHGKTDETSYSLIRGTPLPTSLGDYLELLLDWELLPPGLNLWDLTN
jgi:hypothetical protein